MKNTVKNKVNKNIFPFPCKDTLSVTLQDGVVGLVGMLHGDGLRKFPQHPLLKVLEPLVVIAAAHKLLVLQQGRYSRGQIM